MENFPQKKCNVFFFIFCALFVLSAYLFALDSGFKANPHGQTSLYSLLARSFAHGQLDLLLSPDPCLAEVADPYDPKANLPARINGQHDLCYWQNKLYLPWGPIPAITYYLPIYLLEYGLQTFPTQGFVHALFQQLMPVSQALPDHHILVLAAFGAFLFQMAIFFIFATPPQSIASYIFYFILIITLGLADARLFLLQRVAIYEVSIGIATFFLSGSLYFFTSSLFQKQNNMALFLASLCAGLAAGTRYSFAIPTGILISIFFLYFILKQRKIFSLPVLLSSLPYAVIIILLILYNKARFNEFFNFGLHYQMSGIHPEICQIFPADSRLSGFFQNVKLYILPDIALSRDFPYLISSHPTKVVPGTIATWLGYTGFLFTPILQLIIFFPFFFFAQVRKKRISSLVFFFIMFISGISALFLLGMRPGGTARYSMDFQIWLIPLSILLALWVVGKLEPPVYTPAFFSYSTLSTIQSTYKRHNSHNYLQYTSKFMKLFFHSFAILFIIFYCLISIWSSYTSWKLGLFENYKWVLE